MTKNLKFSSTVKNGIVVGDKFNFKVVLPPVTVYEFLIKLQYEHLLNSHFFKIIIDGYNADDKGIMKLLNEKSIEFRSKILSNKLENKLKKTELMKEKFGLDDNETNDIYDLIEEELDI